MIGSMRELIDVLDPVTISVPGGGYETTYNVLVPSCWAMIDYMSSARQFFEQQLNLNDVIIIKVRERDDWTPNKEQLIRWEGKIYTINSIKPFLDNRRRFLQITAATNEQPVIINEPTT